MQEIISLEHITLLRENRRILDNISFTVESGEHWALLGPNGSGKTTLLKVINGYLWPSDGTVRVLGDEYGHVDIREKRRHIGLVSSALFERIPHRDTLFDVVLSGRFGSLGIYEEIPSADHEKARNIIDFLGCGHLSERPYRVLSFGERQNALLGRALMAEPKILILDEPCEGLDIAARERVLNRIDSLINASSEPTILMVTHRVEELSPGISHVALMNGGRIAMQGAKDDTLTSSALKQIMGVDVELARRNGRIYAHVV